MGFTAPDPDYEARLHGSFAKQGAMALMGIEVVDVSAGAVTLAFDYAPKLTQHHGFIHAGVLTSAMDSAAGYAAATLMERGKAVLTVEFKANWLRPAAGERFLCRGEVIKAGKTLTYTESTATALRDGKKILVARMTATMMAVDGEEKS